MKAKTQRLVVALVVALATAVVLVGGAQADRPDNRAGVLGVGAAGRTASPPTGSSGPWRGAPHRSCARTIVLALSARAASLRLSSPPLQPARPEEGVGIRGARPVATSLVPVVSGDSSGFDWADVSTAVGFVLAMFLLGAAATLAAPHRRHVTLP